MPRTVTTRSTKTVGERVVTVTGSHRVAVCTACGWPNPLKGTESVDGLTIACGRCACELVLRLVRPAAPRKQP